MAYSVNMLNALSQGFFNQVFTSYVLSVFRRMNSKIPWKFSACRKPTKI